MTCSPHHVFPNSEFTLKWHELVKNFMKNRNWFFVFVKRHVMSSHRTNFLTNLSEPCLFTCCCWFCQRNKFGEINSRNFVKRNSKFLIGSGEQLFEELKFTMIFMQWIISKFQYLISDQSMVLSNPSLESLIQQTITLLFLWVL